ncbi:MAG: hypothetical protein ACJ70Y_00115 [Nitrososphaera sp.]
MINNPYWGKKISILLSFSAAILLLLASPLLLSKPLLQPALAQTTMTFRTPTPADGSLSNPYVDASLTFDAQGTTTPGSIILKVTSGTFRITSKENGKILQSGSISSGRFTNLSSGAKLGLDSIIGDPANPLIIDTHCSTSATNGIGVRILGAAPFGSFSGVVECSPQGGNTTANQQQQQSSSSSSSSSATAGSSQDGDRDGIPDSSDKCAHNSNPRCFKEGTT